MFSSSSTILNLRLRAEHMMMTHGVNVSRRNSGSQQKEFSSADQLMENKHCRHLHFKSVRY